MGIIYIKNPNTLVWAQGDISGTLSEGSEPFMKPKSRATAKRDRKEEPLAKADASLKVEDHSRSSSNRPRAAQAALKPRRRLS
jgi:hypothetical protein